MDARNEARSEDAPIRLLISCDMCRQRKVKCDGNKPSCGRCLRMNVNCHYSPITERRRTRKSQSTPKNLDGFQGNMSLTEVLSIHKEINELLERLKDISVSSSAFEPLPAIRESPSVHDSRGFNIDLSSTSSTPHPELDETYSENTEQVDSAFSSSFFSKIDRNKARKYTSSFFKSNHTFLSGLDHTDNLELHLFSQITQHKRSPLLCAVLTSGSLAEAKLSNGSRNSEPYKDFNILYRHLKSNISKVIDSTTVESVITLNILSVVENKLGIQNLYSSLALRLCFRLGLDKPSVDHNINLKKIFWTSLLNDTLTSWVNGENPSIDFTELETSPTACVGHLAALFLKASKKLYSNSLQSLGHLSSSSHFSTQVIIKLDLWYKSLPSSVCFDKADTSGDFSLFASDGGESQLSAKIFIHSLYHALIIALSQNYSSETYSSASSSLLDFNQYSFNNFGYVVSERSLISAGIITDIVSLAQRINPFYYFFGLPTCVYIGSLVYVECIISNNNDSDISTYKSLLSKNINFLEQIGEKNMAQKLTTQTRNALHLSSIDVFDKASQASLGVLDNLLSSGVADYKQNNMLSSADMNTPLNMNVDNDMIPTNQNINSYFQKDHPISAEQPDMSYFGQPSSRHSENSSTIINSEHTNNQLFKDIINFPASENRNIDDIISVAFSSNN